MPEMKFKFVSVLFAFYIVYVAVNARKNRHRCESNSSESNECIECLSRCRTEKKESLAPAVCLAGWTLYNNYCYKLLSDGKKVRDEYDRACGQENSHLVSIHSAEENQFVADFVTATNQDGTNFNAYEIWIGMTLTDNGDPMSSKKYWTDQTNKYLQPGDFGFVNNQLPWYPTQPDGTPSPPTNCVQMWISPGRLHGNWNDTNCRDTSYITGAVCKKATTKMPSRP